MLELALQIGIIIIGVYTIYHTLYLMFLGTET
jgi:hypothetical protein